MKMSENMHDPSRSLSSTGLPARQGLYDPAAEHDSCGVNFVVNMRGVRSHETVQMGLGALCKLEHRGAVGSDPNSGDGAGLLVQIPDLFCRSVRDQTQKKFGPEKMLIFFIFCCRSNGSLFSSKTERLWPLVPP